MADRLTIKALETSLKNNGALTYRCSGFPAVYFDSNKRLFFIVDLGGGQRDLGEGKDIKSAIADAIEKNEAPSDAMADKAEQCAAAANAEFDDPDLAW